MFSSKSLFFISTTRRRFLLPQNSLLAQDAMAASSLSVDVLCWNAVPQHARHSTISAATHSYFNPVSWYIRTVRSAAVLLQRWFWSSNNTPPPISAEVYLLEGHTWRLSSSTTRMCLNVYMCKVSCQCLVATLSNRPHLRRPPPLGGFTLCPSPPRRRPPSSALHFCYPRG